MHYGTECFRYQPRAMLFTAIGYFKPVLQSPELSPEVLAEFMVEESIKLDSMEVFTKQLEEFINTLTGKSTGFKNSLISANKKYSQENLI